jgi:ATP-binding cassette subfamily E protein 1
MEKKMNKLSGGELQRVALAKAISTEAQVYLFDEPSAFLDIEQRFAFSRLLRHTISDSGKSVFVVDHDVIFLDFISNRIIPFEGESSIKGHAFSPQHKKEGMNMFLKMVSITMRRDKDSNRPRINKPESVLDREQREEGNFYY